MVTVDVIECPIHVKINFKNLHDESIMVNNDLIRAKRIYQASKEDHMEGECKVMEINITSLIG